MKPNRMLQFLIGLGGVVSSSLEVKASQEKWAKIKFSIEVKAHYTIDF